MGYTAVKLRTAWEKKSLEKPLKRLSSSYGLYTDENKCPAIRNWSVWGRKVHECISPLSADRSED